MFPKTSFLIGAGSVLNIAGNYFDFNYSESDKQADYKAIASDWNAVGDDVMSAEI